jgi:hypothetical protein
VLSKVGTGRQGTAAGKVYLHNADVLRVVKLLAPGAAVVGEGDGMDQDDDGQDGCVLR